MTGNDKRILHDGFTVADRMGRILSVCSAIHLPMTCRKWAPLCGVEANDLEQMVHQRLWDVWRDEWDGADYPYGGEDDESSWTVPKFAARVAKNVRLELARDNRHCGVTSSPRDPADKAVKALREARDRVEAQRREVGRLRRLADEAVGQSAPGLGFELDAARDRLALYEREMRSAQDARDRAEASGRFRVDRVWANDLDVNAVDSTGAPNWRMLAAKSPDDVDEGLVRSRIARQIDPLGDPARVWDMAAQAADMIIRQFEMRSGSYGRSKLLFDADQGALERSVRDRLRRCVYRICTGRTDLAAADLVDLIDAFVSADEAGDRRSRSRARATGRKG